jgi:hypothetical protein
MGIIMQSGDKSPSEQQSPFWESGQAPQSAVSPQQEAQSVSPPQAQIVGNAAQQQSTQFSGTVNDPAQYVVTSGYDMSGKKKGMKWGQFAKGFFTPYATMMLLTIFSGVEFTDSFLCLMLLIGIVAIVISFARGNKSYGYGLLISVSIPVLWIVFIYGFLILLMLGVA